MSRFRVSDRKKNGESFTKKMIIDGPRIQKLASKDYEIQKYSNGVGYKQRETVGVFEFKLES